MKDLSLTQTAEICPFILLWNYRTIFRERESLILHVNICTVLEMIGIPVTGEPSINEA